METIIKAILGTIIAVVVITGVIGLINNPRDISSENDYGVFRR